MLEVIFKIVLVLLGLYGLGIIAYVFAASYKDDDIIDDPLLEELEKLKGVK